MAKLHFYYSAMNAGKSTVLLQSSYNYQERGMRTIIMMPEKDTRSGSAMIASRIGIKQPAVSFTEKFNVFEYIKSQHALNTVSCVLIDEAQFLTKKQVFQLCEICDKLNIPVLTYGIRTDFKAELFEGSHHLLGVADHLIELKTICHCGAKATMNMRIDARGRAVHEGEQVAIGGNDLYSATCRKHFFEGISCRVSDTEKAFVG